MIDRRMTRPWPATCRRTRPGWACPRPTPRYFRASSRDRTGRAAAGSLSSQYLKMSERTDVCVSLRSSTLPSNSGPNELTVARTWAPDWRPRATGTRPGAPLGVKVQPIDSQRETTSGVGAIARCGEPVRSPLTSATKTGTPASDSCPASSCRVFVLPRPSGIGDEPCTYRLTIEGASWTRGPARQRPVHRRPARGLARRARSRRPSPWRNTFVHADPPIAGSPGCASPVGRLRVLRSQRPRALRSEHRRGRTEARVRPRAVVGRAPRAAPGHRRG